MSQIDNNIDDIVSSEAAPIEDGIGLSIDEVRMLIAREHEMQPPDKSDPVLMVVTMLNACLSEQQALHEKHCKALNRVLGERTDSYVSAIQESVNGLTQSLSNASVQGMKNLLDAHSAQVEQLKATLRLSTAMNVLAALLLVAALIVAQWVKP